MSWTREDLRKRLEAAGFAPRKRFGQNFLTDPHVLERIAALGEGSETEVALEIGSGPGGLTEALVGRFPEVIAAEIDPLLAEIGEARVPSAQWIVGDALQGKGLSPSLAEAIGNRPVTVYGNLPYSFSARLIETLSWSSLPIRNMVLLVQEEMAQRAVAGAGSDAYGPLALHVQWHGVAELAFGVGKDAFWPRPNVASRVFTVELSDHALPDAYRDWPERLFQARRKTMRNALRLEAGRIPDEVGEKRVDVLTAEELRVVAGLLLG